jgi:hypothetical protein
MTRPRPLLDHLIDPEDCALWAPFETLPIVEPLRPIPTLVTVPDHAGFMAARNHKGWLAWQLTRPLRQPKHSTTPIDLARRPRDGKGRFAKKGGGRS